uniref:Uncharacterized protein n=1 Tax=Arion vulgaris TaxID=1028688 RepID=A0A0B7AX93_9EUPU
MSFFGMICYSFLHLDSFSTILIQNFCAIIYYFCVKIHDNDYGDLCWQEHSS